MSSPTLTQLDLPVLGMTCAACVTRVERAISAVPGVATADVNLALSRARVELDPARASAGSAIASAGTRSNANALPSVIASPGFAGARSNANALPSVIASPGNVLRTVIDAIRAAGYEVPADVLDASATGGARLAAIEDAAREDVAGLRRDATLAIAFAIPLLAIAMAHGVVDGAVSVITQLVLGTIVVLGPGWRYLRAGARAVRHGSPDMNTLIALGAGAAWASSFVVAIRWLAGPRHHMPELYFEAGAAIVAFVMIGKLLEARARSRLADAVHGLLSLSPPSAHELVEGTEREVDAAALSAGAVIVVRPGERLPADGTIVEGRSALDEAMLTGEALPVDKAEGAPVYAGTLNHHGALTIRVARAGADTALARIARAVEDAQGKKAPIARLADRVSAWFVPVVLAIGAVTFVAWLLAGAGADVALERTIAVLVIACPCALGLATPAAVAVGTARGAELGILFRSGAALEVGSRIDIVCLDKTGTLTAGKSAVTRVAGNNIPADEMLRFAASAELGSEHPIARAIVAEANARKLVLVRPTDVTADPGKGVTAVVDGKRVFVGARDALLLAGIDPSPIDHTAPAGATLCYVLLDGALAGLIAVADPPAPEAKAAVAALRALEIEPVMITGDRDEVARAIASEVGITRYHAGVAPTGKAVLVAQLREGGTHKVAMVGDGINDAPALASADLGVALASGTDIAAAAADVTLIRGGIAALPTALGLARATMRRIRVNLVAAFAYNVVCIPIAAGVFYPWTGWLLSPVLASAAMSLSSVSVLVSSLRLRRFR